MNKNRSLFYIALSVPVIFWGTLFITASMRESYSHLSNMVSSLGTMGTNTQYYFTAGLVLAGTMSAVLVKFLSRICKDAGLNRLPVLLIYTFSFSIIGAGIFPLPLRLHGLIGSPSIALFIAPLISLFVWHKRADLPNFRLFTLLSFALMCLGFLVFFPEILSNYTGLKQRFFHAGWTVWFIYLGWVFSRKSVAENA